MPGYPIELDLQGRRVLVVGLGRVGTRKATGLVEAGAHVLGVDPNPAILIPGVERRPEPFRPDHLEGMALAFAAASPEVNRAVVAEAKRRGIWVNAASDSDQGDFLVPATWREGLVTVSVSTSGASPALAATLRDRAAEALKGGPALAALLAEMRPLVMARMTDPEARRRLLADWGDGCWLDVIGRDGAEAVWAEWAAMLAGIRPPHPHPNESPPEPLPPRDGG